MKKLSKKARLYARKYGQPPYGREVFGTADLLLQMADKLEEYENLEEQGKLLKLPCAVGDTVYAACSWGIETGIVGSIEIISDRIFVNNIQGQMIGAVNNIFLTKEEAEIALKTWKG